MNEWRYLRLVRKAKQQLRFDDVASLWCQAARLSDDDYAILHFYPDEEQWEIETESLKWCEKQSIVVERKEAWSAVKWLKEYLSRLDYQGVCDWFEWLGVEVDELEESDREDDETFNQWLQAQIDLAMLFSNTYDAILETFVDAEQDTLHSEYDKLIARLDDMESELAS